VVRTGPGLVRGQVEGGIASFKGIPFAAPPEGPLRLRAPAPPTGWDGVRDATVFGPAPPQRPPVPGVPPVWRPGDGLDCLTLNVWSPDLGGGAGLPVMVWLYGGGWRIGASGLPQFDGAVLARSGVVVVTVNYRVGFEGFGQLPGVPDNRGLRDQIAALEWVRSNIPAFGGAADNVTVFGQSAGAGSAVLLAAAQAAAGLFRRVIAQSIPYGYRGVAAGERVTASLAAAAGVAPTWEGFAALPPEAILAAADAAAAAAAAAEAAADVGDAAAVATPAAGAFGPIIDGDLVAGPPWTVIAAGAKRQIDLICGFTHEEYRMFTPAADLSGGSGGSGADMDAVAGSFGLGAGASAAYRAAHPGATDAALFEMMMSDALFRMPATWTAEAHARAGGRTWLYDFAWRGPALGACHCVDVPFVFGNGDNRFAALLLGSPPPADFPGLSAQVRTAWTSFAATGDPGWPRFDLEERRTRIWDTTPADAAYPLADSYRIWRQAAPAA
jgi:para-nitrobenzyl esterase